MKFLFIPLLGLTAITFGVLTPTNSFMTDEEILMIDTSCVENCVPSYMTSLKGGLHECGEFENLTGPWDPCFMKCLGVNKMDNQSKCFCDYCKVGENYRGFCLKPGTDHIGKDDCDSLVCAGKKGKAKFFGSYCSPTSETKEQLERLENEMKKD